MKTIPVFEDFGGKNDSVLESYAPRSVFKDNNSIKTWLDLVGVENYKISSGVVDVNGDVDLNAMKLNFIPVNFGVVKGKFDIGDNNLTSLEGSPIAVGKGFYSIFNPLLTLDFSPENVGGDYVIDAHGIKDVSGIPQNVGGDIDIPSI